MESIEKVLNCEIVFQDHEKVLNFAKTYIKYCKIWKFQIQTFVYSNFVLYHWWQAVLQMFFASCSINTILEK